MNNSNGITLVGLVVTIIIILILAGITLSVMVGENGVISKAQSALKETGIAQLEESVYTTSVDYQQTMAEGEKDIRLFMSQLRENNYDTRNIQDKYFIVKNEEGYRVVVDLSTSEVLRVHEYEKGEIESIVDTSVWDGTSSVGLIGEGIPSYPYAIRSAKDLSYMRDAVNSNGTITGLNIDGTPNQKNVKAATASYELLTDIYLNDISSYSSWSSTNAPSNVWIPIGYYTRHTNEARPFNGYFEGNGYSIYGVYVVSKSGSSNIQTALFGSAVNSTFHGINIEKSYFYSELDGDKDKMQLGSTGALLGFVNYSDITYCSVKDTTVIGKAHTGGMVGSIYFNAKAHVSDVTHSFSDNCNVRLISPTNTNVSYCVGGLIGQTSGYATISYINNCYNNSNVTVDTTNVKVSVGGIAGNLFMKVDCHDCYNTGNISVNSSNDETYVGGIAGNKWCDGDVDTIYNCYNKGNITGGNYQDGIIAKGSGWGRIEVNNCFNLGNIPKNTISDGKIIRCVDYSTRVTLSCVYDICSGSLFKYNTYSINNIGDLTQIAGGESYFYGNSVINNLNWSENDWNINASELPTLKY